MNASHAYTQAALTSGYIFMLSVVGERLAERLRNKLYTSGLYACLSNHTYREWSLSCAIV